MNNPGKTITTILAVIAILCLTLTVISVFFFQKESELRKAAEDGLSQSRVTEAKLQADLKEAKKQVFLMEEKVKESDEKINGLMDDLDLARGVRDEIKKENESLKTALEDASKSKEQVRTQLTEELTTAKQRVDALQKELDAEKSNRAQLETQIQQLQGGNTKAESQDIPAAEPAAAVSPDQVFSEDAAYPELAMAETSAVPSSRVGTISLDPIVVFPDKTATGKVISVDTENNFVVFDLGQNNGIAPGSILSIYRDQEYLGDVKVSRVQSDISAADFIPPFSSQTVLENDQVVSKK